MQFLSECSYCNAISHIEIIACMFVFSQLHAHIYSDLCNWFNNMISLFCRSKAA